MLRPASFPNCMLFSRLTVRMLLCTIFWLGRERCWPLISVFLQCN
jgi:hypothetical protein